MKIFRAQRENAKDLFDWRNDEQSVAMSLDPHVITWEEHRVWYSAAISSKYRFIYLASLPDIQDLIGMVRFDIVNNSSKEKTQPDAINPTFADVSIIVNPAVRGQRLCVPLLTSGIIEFRSIYNIPITAHIKQENKASIKCFEKANFVFVNRYEKSFLYLMKMPVF